MTPIRIRRRGLDPQYIVDIIAHSDELDRSGVI